MQIRWPPRQVRKAYGLPEELKVPLPIQWGHRAHGFTAQSAGAEPQAASRRNPGYGQSHEAALRQARENLGWMARRIEAEPWSDEFAKDLNCKTIPDFANALSEAGRVRDSWLKSRRIRSI